MTRHIKSAPNTEPALFLALGGRPSVDL